jgi:chorismate dehydratase
MPGPVKISIVSYTNTLPFRWAMRHNDIPGGMRIEEDIPSVCAEKLLTGKVDLALVPVAILPRLDKFEVVTDYCIGADGVVDSVKLYSAVPLGEIEEVMLDYQSRTSVALARILISKHWKIAPRFAGAAPGFENEIGGKRAGVVIGDRTFALNGRFAYEYDLAGVWKEFTGLPFVFAVWASREQLDPAFLYRLNSILSEGVNNIRRAVSEETLPAGLDRDVAEDYLTNRIDYRLDARKREGMELFLQYLKGEAKAAPSGNS